MHQDIFANGCAGPGSSRLVPGEPVLAVPVKPLVHTAHAPHLLALVRVGFEQHERLVGRQDDLVGGVAVRPAAVLDQRITVVRPIGQRAAVTVAILFKLVVPPNVAFVETCGTEQTDSLFRERTSVQIIAPLAVDTQPKRSSGGERPERWSLKSQ